MVCRQVGVNAAVHAHQAGTGGAEVGEGVRQPHVAALAAGALAVKLGKDGVEAAIADQKSQALLANALRNTRAISL